MLEAKLEASDQRCVNLLFVDVSNDFLSSRPFLKQRKWNRIALVCMGKLILPGALFTVLVKCESITLKNVQLNSIT